MNGSFFEYVKEKEKVKKIINSFNESTKNENFEDIIAASIIFLAEKHLGDKEDEILRAIPIEIYADDIKQDFLYYYDEARKKFLNKEKSINDS